MIAKAYFIVSGSERDKAISTIIFTTDRSKAVVLVCCLFFVWPCVTHCGAFFMFVMFVILLLFLVGPAIVITS